MPSPRPTSSSSLSSLASGASGASNRRVISSSSSSEHEVLISSKSPVAQPMSRIESPDGPFERMLDEQEKRMLVAIGEQTKLSEKNKQILDHYLRVSSDEVFLASGKENKTLLNRLNITLIEEVDTKSSIDTILSGNVQSAQKVNNPKNSKIETTATNLIPAERLNKVKDYLGGRIKAAATVLQANNSTRLTPEEFIKKINQASIEARFLQLELLLTEKDPNKKPTAEIRERAIHEIILLVTAVKNSSSVFLDWYKKNDENKNKFEQVFQAVSYSAPIKAKTHAETNVPSEEISILKKRIATLENELSQARHASQKAQAKARQLESQSKQHATASANDKQTIIRLKNQVEALQTELPQIKEELEVASKTIREREEAIRNLELQIRELKTTLDNKEQSVQAEQIQRDLELMFIQKEKGLTDQISQLGDEIVSLKKDKNSTQQELQKVLNKVNNSADEKQATINSLKVRLRDSVSSIDEKEKLLKTLTADFDKLRHETDELRAALEDQRAIDSVKISTLESAKRTLEASLSAEKASHSEAALKVNSLEEQVNAINLQLNLKKDQVQDLEGEIVSLRSKLQSFEDENHRYQGEKNKLDAEIFELKAKLEESESKDKNIEEKNRLINELEGQLAVLNGKVSEFEIKERSFLSTKTELYKKILILESDLKSSAENAATAERLTRELRVLTVKISEFEARETAYKAEQGTLQLKLSELQEAYDYLVLTNLFANAFILPSTAIEAVTELHAFIKKYSVQKTLILLEKVFNEIPRLMKDFPAAGAEFAKTSIYMLHNLVESNKMSSLQALPLLLTISSAMSEFLDRSPISQYLNVLVFLVKCEATTEKQEQNRKLIIETLDQPKQDCDFYKVLKQMLKQNRKESLEAPLAEALIEFKLADLVPKQRELFKFIKSLEKDFSVDSESKVFPGEFSIKDEYLKEVQRLENADTSKTSTIQRNGTLRRIVSGSIRIKADNFSPVGFWPSPEEKTSSDTALSRTGSLRRKAYTSTSRVRPGLTSNTFTQPTEQELESSNSNGASTRFKK